MVSGQQHAPAAMYPRQDPVPILHEAGWAPEPVWLGGKSRPHRDSIPDCPARSQYWLHYSFETNVKNLYVTYVLEFFSHYTYPVPDYSVCVM